MLHKSKKQISKDLLEENLYIEGRIERRARQGNLHSRPAPKKHSFIYGLFAALTGAVGYSVFVSYSQVNIDYIEAQNHTQINLSAIAPTQAEINLIIPSIGVEPSAGKEPSAGNEPSAGREPSANKEP